jgi:Mrp family chromosome partitioning ATPase
VDACSRDPALATALAGDFTSDEPVVLDSKDDLARITVHDKASGLALLPIALADLRLLKTQQRRRLATGLGALTQGYDLVLIDAGAPGEEQSGCALLGLADQIVLVARAGVTTRAQIAAVREALEPARDQVIGIVLTRLSQISS